MILDYNLSFNQSPLELAAEIAKPFEKCILKAYWDPVGYPTNGWGNLLLKKSRKSIMKELGLNDTEVDIWLQRTWPPISQETADSDFLRNLNKAYASVKRLVKVKIDIYKTAALIDFAFNCGGGNLQASTLLKMVNRRDFIGASNEFIKWNKASGIVLRGLTRRANSRKMMFLRGDFI